VLGYADDAIIVAIVFRYATNHVGSAPWSATDPERPKACNRYALLPH
jgi:uncharacterized membrane protein YkvA (DUF1232 family)